VETRQCLDSMGRKVGEKLGLLTCHGMGGNQVNIIFISTLLSSNIVSLSTNGVDMSPIPSVIILVDLCSVVLNPCSRFVS